MKGLSEEQFKELWNKKKSFTGGKNQLLYHVTKKIFTQDEIDTTLLYIIEVADKSKTVSKALKTRVKPPPKEIGREGRNIVRSLKKIKDSIPVPISFGSISADDLERAIQEGIEAVEKQPEKIKELVKPFTESNDPKTFIVGLVTLDALPQTKPTKHLQSFFICLLAKHLRLTTCMPQFGFVEQIVRGLFGGERVSAKTIRQRSQDFGKAFPNWPQVAKSVYKAAKGFKVAPLNS